MKEKDREQIGKTYGCYTILEFLQNVGGKRYCLCKCENCGEIRRVGYYKVTHNNYKDCPKCKPKPELKHDLSGKKIGNIEVLERYDNHIQPNGSTKVRYKCLCSCGNEFVSYSDHILSGHTTSCGCVHKKKIKEIHNDITGKKFGRLTVIKMIEDSTKKRTSWLCKCECGNECVASTTSLTTGKRKSCGCLISYAEDKFTELLLEHNITFIKQFKIDGCKDKSYLPFDFAIIDKDKIKLLIELNGQQHYAPFTFNGENYETKVKNFEDRQHKDKIKENFCKENEIPFLVISYKDFDKMWEIFNKFISENKIF